MEELEQVTFYICEVGFYHGGFHRDRVAFIRIREDFCSQDCEVLSGDDVHPGKEVLRGVVVWGEKDACGVVEAPFSGEDAVCAGGGQAPLCVAGVEDIPVCEDDCVWREVLAEVADGRPIRKPGVVAFLLSSAPVDGEDAGAAGEHHFCVREGFLGIGENPDFGRYRHGEGV